MGKIRQRIASTGMGPRGRVTQGFRGQPGSKERKKSGENQKEVRCVEQNVQCNKMCFGTGVNRKQPCSHQFSLKAEIKLGICLKVAPDPLDIWPLCQCNAILIIPPINC